MLRRAAIGMLRQAAIGMLRQAAIGMLRRAAIGMLRRAASVIYKTFDPPLAEGNTTGDDGFILVENWAY